MRTPQEIKEQIEGLKIERTGLPEFSFFSDPNWLKIDAQVSILEGKKTVKDFCPDESAEEFEEKENDVYYAAQAAKDWLEGASNENLFSE